MLIRNKKAFLRGLLFLGSFLVVFVTFFMPVFPAPDGAPKTNGLVYADRVFNTLSKGSANYFDPSMNNTRSVNYLIQDAKDKNFDLTVTIKDEKIAENATLLLDQLGIQAEREGTRVKIAGELFPLLEIIVEDSQFMYNNDADSIAEKHNGIDGRFVVKTWWHLASSMIQPLQQQNQNEEANTVNNVIARGIEPSYNFFGIAPKKVQDNIGLILGFLVFYVVYTMWYGFGIFEIFEGIGLSMSAGPKED